MLMKKGELYVWGPSQAKAFAHLTNVLTNATILGYFDVNDKTQLIADASPVGLGAVLIQINDKRPRIISYASKSLSDVEKRYAQTEKEALALVWAVERFHYYLFGRNFELITDHKPLEVIFGPRSKPCARIERWVLRLQSYNYKVIYQPGKSNIADPLSRLLQHTNETRSCTTFDEGSEHYVNWVATTAKPVALKMDEIIKESVNDEEIKAVRMGVYKQQWTELASPYKIFQNELCFAGEILLRTNRIVMPVCLRKQTIELAHEGHPGMTVMKRRIRSKVWWPKIDRDVEIFIKNCYGCTLVMALPAPEPMKRKELPSEPWQHLAIDYLGPLPSGHHLLVIVDYYSRYVEIEVMGTQTDSLLTIARLRPIFARFGLPLSITADNGGQFISEEFKTYCGNNNIKLISTIPYWPQQNGEVERQNRSIVKRLKISQNTNRNWQEDLQDFLLMYRSTPHSTTLKTPAELLFGRNIRDKLPSIHLPIERNEEVADRDKEKKEKEREYGNAKRCAKEIEIQQGDEVLVKRSIMSNKLSSTYEPDIYKVIERKGSEVITEAAETGKRYRRNVNHVRKINRAETIEETDKPEENDENDTPEMSGVAESRPKRKIQRPGHLKDFVNTVDSNIRFKQI